MKLRNLAGLAVCLLAQLAALQTAAAHQPAGDPPQPVVDAPPPDLAPPVQPPPKQHPDDNAVVPNSPAGHKLAWALSLFRGAEPGDLTQTFHEQFLRQVPPASFLATLERFRAELFPDNSIRLEQIDRDEPHSIVAIVSGGDPRRMYSLMVAVHDESHKITGLLVQPHIAPSTGMPGDWEQLDEKLSPYGSGLSVGVYQLIPDDDATKRDRLLPIYTRNETLPLGVGSTFKLYVLGAVAEAVRAGELAWDQTLAIDDARKSLPSGKMQNEDAGKEFPLTQYANLMISISDNTATDHLLHLVGREKVEAYMTPLHTTPGLNKPFLSTRELFNLKLGEDQEITKAYIAAAEPDRRAMLAPDGAVGSQTPNLAGAATWVLPRYVKELEWFASVEDCSMVMADLRRLEKLDGMAQLGQALRLNPGIPFDREQWPSIGFKGGSEPGVINLTWLLERSDGAWYTISLTMNDPTKGIDQERTIEIARNVINLAAQEPDQRDARPGRGDGN